MTEPKTTLEDRRATLEPLIIRAWSDAGFRARLTQRPREAFEEATGLRVPAGVELQVHQSTMTQHHLEVLDPADPGFAWERVSAGWAIPADQAKDDPSSFRGGYWQACRFVDQLVRQLWSDHELLGRLESAPHEVIGSSLQLREPMPPSLAFTLVRDTPEVRHVVVMFRPDADGLDGDRELSELELETVAGGTSGPAGPTQFNGQSYA
jgi:hypothetical protein